MIGAGLLARNAVQRGMKVQPYVKTSLAPGSPVVVDYLEKAGLLKYLDQLRFNVVGFGCTTCIGNSGPLPPEVSQAVRSNDLVVAAVLSGNRNFEGRINPDCKMNFLASPPLVVAYALAGSVDLDLTSEPLGVDDKNQPVYLRDIWPSDDEVAEAVSHALRPEDFVHRFSSLFTGDERWRSLPVPEEISSTGTRARRTSRSRPSSPTSVRSPRLSRRSTAPGSSPSSATRSRPTTSRPRGRSRSTHRLGCTSSNTASSPRTSALTALGAATTR